MVRVTPNHYSLRGSSSAFPGLGSGTVLALYFVGDAAGYQAFGSSWILDDRGYEGGTEVRADPDDVIRWTEAQHVAETALREAETRLLHDRGMMEIRDGGMRTLCPDPGWRGFGRRLREFATRQAFAHYRLRTLHIRQTYRPIRDEIDARVREVAQRARERQERIHAVARRTRWDYRVDWEGGVVHVFRAADATLVTHELAGKLLAVSRDTGVFTLRWDEQDRAEIERDSGVDFDTWWRALVSLWHDPSVIPQTALDRNGRTVHVSAHTSFGIGGHHGGFGGIH